MYKNITYFNKQKSIKKYEKRLLESSVFENATKTKNSKNEIVYVTPDVLITIKKTVINFLVFNYKNFNLIDKIENLSETKY